MQDTTSRGPIVRFRVDQFDRITEALGYRSEADKAAFVGCDQSTIWRQRRQKTQPSVSFIAQVLAALPHIHPAQLFDFGVPDDRAA